MAESPDPAQIFERAAGEGKRRLGQTWLELASNAFIAGFTIVFGVAAAGIVHAFFVPHAGQHLASLAGALVFGIGVIFLIVGRTELFTENFFDPIATAVDEWQHDRWDSAYLGKLARLWGVSLVFNVLGAGLLVLLLSVPQALPHGTDHSLAQVAEAIAARPVAADFVRAFVGGALVTMLSFLIEAANHVTGRIVLAYIVGFLLALGPFDHVIVTGSHLLFGVLFGAKIDAATFAQIMGIAVVGNMVGGLGLVSLTHITQAVGAEQGSG